MSKAYSEAKKYQVVTTYLVLGKAPMVAAVTGVPPDTIRHWKLQPWWRELENEIRSEETAELDSKLTKIIDRSLDTVVDRIEHGDFILDSRSGTVKRVPVKLRDVHKVSTELIDKRALIRKPTHVREDKTTTEEVIKKLASQFAEFASRAIKRESEKVIEGEVIVDAVYDEWSEGLQERKSEVQLQTLRDTETGRTEQSPPNDGT